jgi:hypothetical protein
VHHCEELIEMIETDIALDIFGVPKRKIYIFGGIQLGKSLEHPRTITTTSFRD